MRGSARDMLVRSMNAMVYMKRATGMMRVQRLGAGAEVAPGERSAVWAAGSIIRAGDSKLTSTGI